MPHTWRPLGVRIAATVLGSMLALVVGFAWLSFDAHLPPGAPWVTLDLDDGTTVSAMGIQGSDGARAQTALRELRALLDAASA